MTTTRRWLLAHKPKNAIQLEGPEQTFVIKDVEIPALQDDELLLKTLFMSNDPAQRGWM